MISNIWPVNFGDTEAGCLEKYSAQGTWCALKLKLKGTALFLSNILHNIIFLTAHLWNLGLARQLQFLCHQFTELIKHLGTITLAVSGLKSIKFLSKEMPVSKRLFKPNHTGLETGWQLPRYHQLQGKIKYCLNRCSGCWWLLWN